MEEKRTMHDFKVIEESILLSDDVFKWIFNNRSALKGLTDNQTAVVRGRLYLAGTEKKSAWDTVLLSRLANEFGITALTVKRSVNFTNGIDKIRKAYPKLAEDIINGKARVNQLDVQIVGRTDQDNADGMIDKIVSGGILVPKRNKKEEIRHRKEMEEIVSITDSLFSRTTEAAYTIDSLIHDIRINSAPIINQLRKTIKHNIELCRKNKMLVIKTITEDIILKIEEIEEEITNE